MELILKKSCIYSGTFDPITNGHLDVIIRAQQIFDKIIVAVAASENKKPYFSLDERIKMAKVATKDLENIEVLGFDNLLVDFAKQQKINYVIRGLRAVSDFEYELQMGYANSSLWDKFDTVYLMPSLKNAFISSSIVRAIFTHGGNADHLVPKDVYKLMQEYKKC